MIFQGHSPRDCENRCAPRRMASAMMTNPVARKTPRCACPAAVSARTIVLRQAAPVTKPRKYSSSRVTLARTNCKTSLPAERHTTNVNPVANKMPSNGLIDDMWRTHFCVPRRLMPTLSNTQTPRPSSPELPLKQCPGNKHRREYVRHQAQHQRNREP